MRKFVSVLCLTIIISLSIFAQGIDPCTQNTPLTGGTAFTVNSNGSKPFSNSPFSYEIWTQGGSNNRLTWYGTNQGGGAAFKAEWNNPNDYLGRVGYYWNQNKPYTDYKNVYCDFNYTRSGRSTAGSYSYIGIYGWSRNPNAADPNWQLIEYYIVEDWFGNQWQSDTTPVGINTTGGKIVGNFTVDGSIYDIIVNTRVNQPSIDGTKTFTQIFSVRRTPRKCGTISVTEQFKKWNELYPVFGNRMYECKFLVEAGGGTGFLDLSYLSFSQEDEPRSTTFDNTLTVGNSPKMYVNTENYRVNVNFTATGNGKTELKLYSVVGNLIASEKLQTVAGKDYSYTFNQGELPRGFYVVWMNNNGSIKQVKVVIS